MQSTTQKTTTTINPSNGNEIKSYPLMSEDQVSQTIESCQKAFLSWRLKSLEERVETIKKIGTELENNKQQLAELMTLEMGKPLSQAIEDAGRLIAERAGKNLKKTVMELGSNDAYIVLEDADIKKAVEQCVAGRIYNNGQTCVAAKRFVVVDKIYDQFRDHYVKAMQALKMGDPTSSDTELGPMAREDLRDKLHDQVMKSVNKGATILCGGEIPHNEGFYYPATVLENVEPGQPAYDDELFGPVAALIRASDQDDAMRIANDSAYGLGGAIFSKNIGMARALAIQHFDTGMVFINGFGVATPEMPFGGVKNSGYGREHGGFGMKEFVNIKSVMVMG